MLPAVAVVDTEAVVDINLREEYQFINIQYKDCLYGQSFFC
jgi:hypothetical protein